MKSKIAVLILALILIPAAGFGIGAQDAGKLLTAQVGGQFSVSFKTRTDPPRAFKPMSSMVHVEANIVHRVWIDSAEGIYFGYDLEIEMLNDRKQFRVSIKSLGDEYARKLEERKSLRPLTERADLADSDLLRFPQPLVVNDGDSLALDVLVNRKTGVRLVDLITVSSSKGLVEDPSLSGPARDFSLSDVQLIMRDHQLFINGELATGKNNSGSCAGEFIYFYLPGRGRFIFSIKPHKGYRFQKIGAIHHNKISFSIGGDVYEWVSNAPIVGTGGNWNLWILHEPNFVLNFDDKNSAFTFGAMGGTGAIRQE